MDVLGRRQLERLAASLETEHPGAVASIRERLAENETPTLRLVGIGGAVHRTLRGTRRIGNLGGSVGGDRHHLKRCS